MSFKCGIIGLPNVGKSTIFNALTKSQIATANFPFCTINPNFGTVFVPDKRIEKILNIISTKKVTFAQIEFVDIAGLVEGASRGEGLGNKFLENIRQVDAICHVVRCFENENITHVCDKVNPENDINLINVELILSDLSLCEKIINKTNKDKFNDVLYKKKIYIFEKCLYHLEKNKLLKSLNLTKEEKDILNYINFLTIKPTLYIANIDEHQNENNFVNILNKLAKENESSIVIICGKIEEDLIRFNKNDRMLLKKEMGIKNFALNKIIHAGYKLLNLNTFFTVGYKEIKAWTIKNGSYAEDAAGKIHTDFKKGFIKAQVISFKNFIEFKGFQGAKNAGKLSLEGKKYIVKDGDIINFLFNV